jgi:hypothetical protein
MVFETGGHQHCLQQWNCSCGVVLLLPVAAAET